MSTSNHTPGPWYIYGDGIYDRPYDRGKGVGNEIARVSFFEPDVEGRGGDPDADLHVISAAPHLLSALKALTKAVRNRDSRLYDNLADEADRAIEWAEPSV